MIALRFLSDLTLDFESKGEQSGLVMIGSPNNCKTKSLCCFIYKQTRTPFKETSSVFVIYKINELQIMYSVIKILTTTYLTGFDVV